MGSGNEVRESHVPLIILILSFLGEAMTVCLHTASPRVNADVILMFGGCAPVFDKATFFLSCAISTSLLYTC